MEKLIKAAKNGDPDAFSKLMQSQMQNMYKTARAILRSDEDIADAISDTILVCWEKLCNLREEKYFRTWMTRILINKCKDIIRRQIPLGHTEEVQEKVYYDLGYEKSEWKQVLDSVDEKYRLILVLYYVEGFRTGEISRMLGIPESTVRTRLARGRECLVRVCDVKRRSV